MDYQELLQKIKTYEKNYNVKVIGKSELNKNIYAVEKILKEDFSTAILIAGIHGREYITCDLLCKMLDENIFDEIKNFNLSFILMANPDGVELSKNNLKNIPKKYHKNLLKINNSEDFSLWKANAKGVDLNNNFDANFSANTYKAEPSSSGFVGKHPESEKESRAIAQYVRSKNVFFTISYHSKGEEIYFNFFQDESRLKRDRLIAERFFKSTGYAIKNVESVSSGGLKDYCVQKLKIPSITIELGSDDLVHPIEIEFLQEIYQKHLSVAKDLQFAYNVFRRFEEKWYGISGKVYEKSV